jgi:hypothetical protein
MNTETKPQKPFSISNFFIMASSYEVAIEAGHQAAKKVKENNSTDGVIMIRGERVTWQIK